MAEEHDKTQETTATDPAAGEENAAAEEPAGAEDTAAAEATAGTADTAAEETEEAAEAPAAEPAAEAESAEEAPAAEAVEPEAGEDAAAETEAAASQDAAAESEAAAGEPETVKAAEVHSYDELKGMTVAAMREIAESLGDHDALHGYTTMHKEELLVALCKAQGIEAHEHHEVVGIDKAAVKAKIRALKEQRAALIEARDAKQLRIVRRRIRSLKRKIHKATV